MRVWGQLCIELNSYMNVHGHRLDNSEVEDVLRRRLDRSNQINISCNSILYCQCVTISNHKLRGTIWIKFINDHVLLFCCKYSWTDFSIRIRRVQDHVWLFVIWSLKHISFFTQPQQDAFRMFLRSSYIICQLVYMVSVSLFSMSQWSDLIVFHF